MTDRPDGPPPATDFSALFSSGEVLSPFGQMLGEEIVSVSPDQVVLRLEVQPKHHQPFGIVHGGVWASMVETAGSIAGAVWVEGKKNVVGVSNQTDFIRAVREGIVTAVATPIHRGRSQQLWEVRITDDQERLVARGQVRLQNLEHQTA